MAVLDPSASLVSFVKAPWREVYGIKKEFFLSRFPAQKIRAIAAQSGRNNGAVFSFCIKHALHVGAYKCIPNKYRVLGEKESFGTRIPARWYTDFKDLGWDKSVSFHDLCSYFCSYSLSSKSVSDWVIFFREGQDLIFDFWFFIHNTLCQTSNPYSQILQNIPKLSIRSKT